MRAALVALGALAVMAQAHAQAPASGGSAGSQAPSAMSAPDAWVTRGVGELVLLDKLRGQVSTVAIKAGESAVFGALTVLLRSCAVRPPDLAQNAAAFLEVREAKHEAPIFRGWVLANTPSAGQIEDPVYDLRLVACR